MEKASEPCTPYKNHHHQLTVEKIRGMTVMSNHCQLHVCNGMSNIKGLYKVILEYKNEAPQLKKWAWQMHNAIL